MVEALPEHNLDKKLDLKRSYYSEKYRDNG